MNIHENQIEGALIVVCLLDGLDCFMTVLGDFEFGAGTAEDMLNKALIVGAVFSEEDVKSLED